jgi:DNA-binding response OmpR family regulator
MRAVEVLPEGTRRGGPLGGIGPRCAFVVDASSSGAKVITCALSAVSDFSVETFGAADEALRRSLQRPPDIMVMEPRSLRIDALIMMRLLRELHGSAAPPVVWCTSVVPTPQQLDEGTGLGLRGVIVKPFRLEALTALVLRVCRTAERERRLLTRGVTADQLAALPLSSEVTGLWVEVEVELAETDRRPLSLVVVGADGHGVISAVLGAVRASDIVGRGFGRTLFVLLPDSDEMGAAVVADRVAMALSRIEPPTPVRAVTLRPGEDGTTLLARTVLEAVLARSSW